MIYIATKVCKTGDIGVNGNLFGGIMMSWLDEAGIAVPIEEEIKEKILRGEVGDFGS
jgi:acyl-CoA hydrolase